ncbi:MAG: polysaccharide biosynthesis/export family protein [Verrucomicrobiota bacterium]
MKLALLAALLCTGLPGFGSESRSINLKAGDEVRVQFLKREKAQLEELFHERATIDGSGRLQLPEVGRIKIDGRSGTDLLEAVIDAYRQQGSLLTFGLSYAAHLTEYNGQPIVLVEGRVESPGYVLWKEDMSLQTALEAAGGLREDGSPRTIHRISAGIDATYNILTSEEPISLQPGDVVRVPFRYTP